MHIVKNHFCDNDDMGKRMYQAHLDNPHAV